MGRAPGCRQGPLGWLGALGWAGRDPPCCWQGLQGTCSWVLLLQVQGVRGASRAGGEGSVELGEDEDAQAEAAQQSSSPCCEMGWPRSRQWRGQGQMVALICKRGSWAGSRRHPWAGEAAALQLLSKGTTASGLETGAAEIHCIFSLFFFPPMWMGINPETCSQGTRPDTAS